MKLTFEVPDTFKCCVLTTVLYDPDTHDANIYTVTRTKDDFVDGYVKCYPFDNSKALLNNEKSD